MTDPHDDHHRKGILEQLDEDKGHPRYGMKILWLLCLAVIVAGLIVIFLNLGALAPFGGE